MSVSVTTSGVRVALGPRSYDIVVTSAGWGALPDVACQWLASAGHKSNHPRALLVTDEHLETLLGQPVQSVLRGSGWDAEIAVLPAGERTKSLAASSQLYDVLVEQQADRHTCVIAVGGGVMGDLAGFVAATYARGLPFIQIPTTLLAQVDSSVGGKVGINHPRGKNLIGAFHQPVGVYIDIPVLESLPARDYASGMAEVIKYGVILDPELFAYLETHIPELNARDRTVLEYVVTRCCRLKADVVEHDEFERTGLRAVLNYGHTFAHAFEALCGYGELTHGEAVSIGMVCASRLAERRGMIPAELTARQIALLSAVGLPTRLDAAQSLSTDAILNSMRLDKKSVGGQLRFILPTRLGEVRLVADVPEIDVRRTLEE